MAGEPAEVRCPTCGRPVKWSADSPFRPFCSERCKLIDLGEWIEEKHRIEGDDADSDGSPREPGSPH